MDRRNLNGTSFTGFLAILISIALLTIGCTPTGPTEPTPSPPEKLSNTAEDTPIRGTRTAVDRLLSRASQLLEHNQLSKAESNLDRALNLRPDHPRIWYLLARIRYKESQYPQAVSLAKKSISLIGPGERSMRNENWTLIADIRLHQGDRKGYHEALERME